MQIPSRRARGATVAIGLGAVLAVPVDERGRAGAERGADGEREDLHQSSRQRTRGTEGRTRGGRARAPTAPCGA